MTKLFIKHTTLVFQFTLQNNNYLTKTRKKDATKMQMRNLNYLVEEHRATFLKPGSQLKNFRPRTGMKGEGRGVDPTLTVKTKRHHPEVEEGRPQLVVVSKAEDPSEKLTEEVRSGLRRPEMR
jgi:hypothetical protein